MKKQLAVVMAAATAVTTVAPAVVSADVIQANDTEAVKALKNTVKENMRLKYVDDANQLVAEGGKTTKEIADTSVFKVVMTIEGVDKEYTTYSAFEKAFDDAYTDLDQGASIQVNLVSNFGYRALADGTITNADEADTYEKLADGKLSEDGTNAIAAKDDATKVGEVEEDKEDDGNYTYKIKLSNYDGDTDRYLAIAEGDDVLDTTKPMLKVMDGFYVNEDGDPILEQKDKDVVALDVDAETIKITRDDDGAEITQNNCVVDGFQVKLVDAADVKTIRNAVQKDVETFEVKAQDFYDVDNGRLTVEANNLLAKLEREHDFESMDGNNTIVYKDGNGNKVAKVKIVKDSGDKDGKAYKAVTVEGVLENMAKLKSEDAADKNYIVQAAGEDRYASAVQVARAMTQGEDTVSTVVLVSGDSKAMVDGLTAAPYAKLLGDNVPVLLTQKDALPESVVDFLKDKNVQTVKVIGGENSVSQKVMDQLENDLVITDTERFSGADRFATAMEVADEFDGRDDNKAYLVSGYATPDSLSIAGVAAYNESPILLTKKDEIPSDVKTFIEDHTDKTVNIIGGLNSVSNAVVRTILADVDGASINRVSGDDRQATNAEVIEAFTKKANDVVIARGDGHAIIDALAAGAYAGQAEKRALVLTGANGMSRDQKDNLDDEFKTVLQVGYSVNATDADYIFDNISNPADGE